MKFEHMWKDKSRDFPVLRGAWRLFHHVLRSCESSQEHTVAVLTRLDSASSGYLFRRVLFVFVFSFLEPWNVTPSSRADTGGVLSERTVGKQTRLTNRSG